MPGVNIGFSVDQSRTNIDVPLALQSATLDLTQLGFNASVDKGPWTWAVAVVHGFGNINASRDTGLGIASAGYDAQIDGVLTEIDYYWSDDQSRIVPKAGLEYVRSTTAAFQEIGGLNPVTESATTLERSRLLLGAEIGHYFIFDQKVLDLSAYGKFVDNFAQNFGSILVTLGPQSISVAGIGESQYGADAGAAASLSLTNTARLYLNYDAKFRANLQSHQATLGFEYMVRAVALKGLRRDVTLKPEILARGGHQRHEIGRVNELVPETGIGFGIEDALQPVDDELVAIGIAELLVIGEPQIHVVIDAEVDRHERRAERNRRGRQKTDAGAALDGIKNRDAGIGRYPDDAVRRF